MSQASPIPGGYILLARKIVDSELYMKPPHYLKLWLWMLCKAFWIDGEKVKRGQLLTTIDELRNVGLYRSGGRLQGRLTVDEVRSAYGFLRDKGSITVSKTTRGLLVTILNYDAYQAPESYESHTDSDITQGHVCNQPEWLALVSKEQISAEPPRATPGAPQEVSIVGQALTAQREQLKGTGVDKVFKGKASGVKQDRSELPPGITHDFAFNTVQIPENTPDPTHEQPEMLVNVGKNTAFTGPGPHTISGTPPDPTPEPAHKHAQHVVFVSKKQTLTGSGPHAGNPPDPIRQMKHNNIKISCASPSSKRPPSGDHQTFIAWWCFAYERTQGKPYLMTGKDFRPVKDLLTTHGLKPLVVMAAWFLTCNDSWLANKRDIAMLRNQINRIPGPKDPAHDARAYRAAGIIPPDGVRLEDWRFWETEDAVQEAAQ